MKKLLLFLLCVPLIGLGTSDSLKMHESSLIDSFISNHYLLYLPDINTDHQISSSLL